MGNASTGAKAGIISGIAYGVVLAITTYFIVTAMKSTIISAITKNTPSTSLFTPEQLYGIVVLVAPVVVIIGGLLGGVIVGAVYGRFYDRIPGRSSIVKGIVVGIILWLILSVIGGLGDFQYGVADHLTSVGTGLVAILLFGILLGYFYGKFVRPPKLDPTVQTTQAL